MPTYQGDEIEVFILTPNGLTEPAQCLVHIHGGGFVFEGSNSHFRLAMTYEKEAHCKAVYVRYCLAPKHPFPVPQEDCYAALCWVYDHADELAMTGTALVSSATARRGTLSVTTCMMARDRGAEVKPLFQLLVYPWLDGRNNS